MSTSTAITQILETQLQPSYLKITDQTSFHAGHPETQKSSGGHFHIVVICEKFKNMNLMERHRLIYALLKKLLPSEIHALAIKAFTKDEWEKAK